MDRNRARGFLNASLAPEHLNSVFMQMSCHLLRRRGCTPLNRRTSLLWSGGASLRQKEIRTHARQALACNKGEKTTSGVLLSRICRWECSWISLAGRVLGRVIFVSLDKPPPRIVVFLTCRQGGLMGGEQSTGQGPRRLGLQLLFPTPTHWLGSPLSYLGLGRSCWGRDGV